MPLADVVPQAVAVSAPRVLTDNASDTMRGIALAVLAYLIWTLGDTTAKWVLPESSAWPARCCGAVCSARSRSRR